MKNVNKLFGIKIFLNPMSQKRPNPQRLLMLVPILALAVIAPSACYYYEDEYAYQAEPYSPPGSHSTYRSPSSSYGYDRSGYYGRSQSSRYPSYGHSSPYGHGHGHGHQESRHGHTQQRQQASRQMEERNESNRESKNEGWKYEDRDERRKRGAEEPYEERKKR